MTKHILVAVDLTHEGEAKHLLGEADRLAGLYDAGLSVVTVLPDYGSSWVGTFKCQYRAHQREIGEAYRRVFGRHFPAMSMVVVKELIEDDALVEIEATAFVAPSKE